MLQCPKCNYDNELGRIFCHACGTKLDLTQIKPPSEGTKMRRRVQHSVMRTVRVLIELAIVGVLVLGMVLMCLTPQVRPVKETNAEVLAADTKNSELRKLVANPKGGKIVVSEAEFNAFLKNLDFEKPTGNGIEVVPVALRTTFKDGSVMVEFVGDIHFGSAFTKSLYLGYDCTPVIRDGQCRFQPNGGWLGKLPLHPKLLGATPFVDNYFGRLFGKLDDDKKQALDPLSKITVSNGTVTFEKEAAH